MVLVAIKPCFFVVDFCFSFAPRIFDVLGVGFTMGSSIIAVSVGAYLEMSVVTAEGVAVSSFDVGLELGLLDGFEEEL